MSWINFLITRDNIIINTEIPGHHIRLSGTKNHFGALILREFDSTSPNINSCAGLKDMANPCD
jgi:hypothetical protein